MADAVDDSSGPERNPHHLDAPYDRPNKEAEQVDVDTEHKDDAKRVPSGKHMPLEPVVRSSLSILLENSGLLNRLPIVEGTLEDDVPQSFEKRAVRIALTVSKSVMLSVTGNPLLRDDRRRQPQPQPHWQRSEIMQLHAAMCLRAMQKQRN